MELHDNLTHNPDDTPTRGGADERSRLRTAGEPPITREDRGRKPTPALKLLAAGSGALDDRELMALVLGDRVRATLDELLHADPADLVASRALSPHQAAKLAGALEFCRRLARRQRERTRLSTASAVWSHVRPSLTGLRREVFRVLCLDTRSGLLREAVVAEGSVDSCHVDPREVFAPAIACRASGVVLVHNLPPGGRPHRRHRDGVRLDEAASGLLTGVS